MGNFFRAMEKLENALNESRFGTAPRELNNGDIVDWTTAGDHRKPTLRSKEQIIHAIKSKNSYRWFEYKRQRRWVQKQMRKLGLDPDDEKWLL